MQFCVMMQVIFLVITRSLITSLGQVILLGNLHINLHINSRKVYFSDGSHKNVFLALFCFIANGVYDSDDLTSSFLPYWFIAETDGGNVCSQTLDTIDSCTQSDDIIPLADTFPIHPSFKNGKYEENEPLI